MKLPLSAFLVFCLALNPNLSMRSYSQTIADSAAVNAALIGLDFQKDELDSLRPSLSDFRKFYQAMRQYPVKNDIIPALVFNPVPPGFKVPVVDLPTNWTLLANFPLPDRREDLAFYSVMQLASLIKNRKITSVELTQFFLNRLKKYDPLLHCVVSTTEKYALEAAAKADGEIAHGHYRGPLHGIPFGAKDLLSFKDYRTTWGAEPYKTQESIITATVLRKLEDAGAILVAKLTLGELAMDDVWFGGMTRNPWDLNQGSSGSSAGSAAAVSAGLVPFAIGSETWGSIVSPSDRCGVTGLRPTFGRVSRYGAMALSWSMDKLGPITRTVEDCALVFDAIYGPDGLDPSVIRASFHFDQTADPRKLRVGYFRDLFSSGYENKKNDSVMLARIRDAGVNLIPVNLPSGIPVQALSIILEVEAAAAFEELTLSDRDTLLARQGKENWPNIFRRARFIPAVEYIQANRIRQELLKDFNNLFNAVDVIITPSFAGDQLLMTNLTGNPCIVLPDGFDASGHPASICAIGRLFDEGNLLLFGTWMQALTDSHLKHPTLFLK